jgi:hypothetical protein
VPVASCTAHPKLPLKDGAKTGVGIQIRIAQVAARVRVEQ